MSQNEPNKPPEASADPANVGAASPAPEPTPEPVAEAKGRFMVVACLYVWKGKYTADGVPLTTADGSALPFPTWLTASRATLSLITVPEQEPTEAEEQACRMLETLLVPIERKAAAVLYSGVDSDLQANG